MAADSWFEVESDSDSTSLKKLLDDAKAINAYALETVRNNPTCPPGLVTALQRQHTLLCLMRAEFAVLRRERDSFKDGMKTCLARLTDAAKW